MPSPYAGILADYLLGGAKGPIPDEQATLSPDIIAAARQERGPLLAANDAAPPIDYTSAMNAANGTGEQYADAALPAEPVQGITGNPTFDKLTFGVPAKPVAPPPTLPAAGPPAPPVATGGGPPTPDAATQDEGRAINTAMRFLQPSAGAGGGASRSVTTVAGNGLSAESLGNTQRATQAAGEVTAANQEGDAARARQLAAEATTRADAAQQEANRRQALAQAAKQRQADWDAQWQAASKEDPSDVFHGNVAAGILATIGQAMGAFSAAINHTDNWAARAISEAVSNNVKVQMAKRQGLYQRFRDAGLDADQAQRAAEAAGLQVAANMADRSAALAASDKAKGAANQTRADLMVKVQQLQNDNEIAEKGKVSTTVTAHAGGGGGGLSPELISKRREELVKIGDTKAVEAFDKAVGLQGQGPHGADARTAAEQKIKGPSDALLDAANDLLPKMGARVDPSTGKWKTDVGAMAGSLVPFSTEKHAKTELINMLAPDIATIRKGGGAAPSKEEIEHVREELSTKSPEQFDMAINLAVKRAQATKHQKIFHSSRQIAGGDEAEP